MKKIISILATLTLFVGSCTKDGDKTFPLIDQSAKFFTISDGDPSKKLWPRITFEISDTTFSENSPFNYHSNSPESPYIGFFPSTKILLNPAYLTYDYRDTEILTGFLAYRVKYVESGNVQSAPVNDTATWVLVPNVQFNSATKIYKIPVSDFAHVYFVAKK